MADGGRRWLKYFGFGCLGCLGLIVVCGAFFIWLGWSRAKTEQPEERVLTHEAPAQPPAPQAPPARPTTETVEAEPTKKPGKLVLDLSEGEFHITPGHAGDPIRVQATYDKKSYALEESSETAADGTWVYRVEFRRTGSPAWVVDIVQRIFSKSRPVVRVSIPPGVPLALEAAIRRGGGDADLGGLHLTTASIAVDMGGLELSFAEPTAVPVERLELNTSMGGGEFHLIGNASPRVLTVDYRMGGADLDLGGEWRTDSEITVRGSQGGLGIRLPDGVRVEGVPNRKMEPPEAGELRRPTLRFTADSRFDDVDVR